MRNVIFAINITLDGCCDHAKLTGDEGIHEYFTRLMRDVDLLVFGRKTYQLMVPFWPEVAKTQSMTKASNEFAQTFDSINKIVFSRSLGSAEDKNTRIVRTNLHDKILKLKQEQGKNILVGGVSIPSQLIELGLAGCGKTGFCRHTELAHGVFSNGNEHEERAYSAVGTNDRAVGEGCEPLLDLLGPCRDTTPHTFPAGMAVARFRMRTRL